MLSHKLVQILNTDQGQQRNQQGKDQQRKQQREESQPTSVHGGDNTVAPHLQDSTQASSRQVGFTQPSNVDPMVAYHLRTTLGQVHGNFDQRQRKPKQPKARIGKPAKGEDGDSSLSSLMSDATQSASSHNICPSMGEDGYSSGYSSLSSLMAGTSPSAISSNHSYAESYNLSDISHGSRLHSSHSTYGSNSSSFENASSHRRVPPVKQPKANRTVTAQPCVVSPPPRVVAPSGENRANEMVSSQSQVMLKSRQRIRKQNMRQKVGSTQDGGAISESSFYGGGPCRSYTSDGQREIYHQQSQPGSSKDLVGSAPDGDAISESSAYGSQSSMTSFGQSQPGSSKDLVDKTAVNIARFQKTRLCRFMQLGKCTKGQACPFAHSQDEIKAQPDLHRTQLCQDLYRKGRCDNPKCTFAHSKDELRASEAVYKTKPCHFWLAGCCHLGSACRFAHSREEMRMRQEDGFSSPQDVGSLACEQITDKVGALDTNRGYINTDEYSKSSPDDPSKTPPRTYGPSRPNQVHARGAGKGIKNKSLRSIPPSASLQPTVKLEYPLPKFSEPEHASIHWPANADFSDSDYELDQLDVGLSTDSDDEEQGEVAPRSNPPASNRSPGNSQRPQQGWASGSESGTDGGNTDGGNNSVASSGLSGHSKTRWADMVEGGDDDDDVQSAASWASWQGGNM